MTQYHIPVMLKESIDYLITSKDGSYFDATLGFGGHSLEILKRLNTDAKLIATDIDDFAFNLSKERFKDELRISIYKFNYSMIDIILKIEMLDGVDGIIADLGVSSYQLDNKEAGFTYRENTNLDLRMDKSINITAAEILNQLDEKQIADIFYLYGEEKNSKKIANEIVKIRKTKKIKTTFQFNEIIEKITPKNYLTKTLSRVYQALRIYINDELTNLKNFLTNGLKVLNKGGRFVVISYHSLEDRIVKEFFVHNASSYVDKKKDPFGIMKTEPSLKILTKKPLVPSGEEISLNKRARSAKLRVAEKL